MILCSSRRVWYNNKDHSVVGFLWKVHSEPLLEKTILSIENRVETSIELCYY